MIRKVLLIAMGVAAALVLGVAATAAPRETTTLKILLGTENRAQWDAMIGNFERQFPNVHIEASYVPGASYGALLLTQFQSGSAPDLITIQTGASTNFSVYALGSQGKLLALDGSPWIKRIYSTARKLVAVRNHVYGFPAGYNLLGLLYNPAVLSRLGLKVPTTFSALLAACQSAATQGTALISLGMATPATAIQLAGAMMDTFVYQQDPQWTLKRNQRKVTFATSPLWRRMLQGIVDMKDAKCFQPSPAGVSRPAAQAMFANGQVAMTPGATGDYGVIKSINPNVDMQVIAFPADSAKDSNPSITNGQLVIAVNKSTTYPKEARQFVDFIARPKQNSLFCKVGGCVAGDDLRKGIIPDYAKATISAVRSGKANYNAAAGWPRIDKGLFIPNFIGQVPGLFTGQRTVDQILAFMDELWDKP